MSNISWSAYSLDIFKALRTTSDSLVIAAVAGSGKTTNAVEIANIIETEHLGTYAFYAFNVDIVNTLKGRLSNPNAARTLNSLGANMLYQKLGFYPKVDKFKYPNMVKDTITGMVPDEKVRETANSVREILGKAMAELVYPHSATFAEELENVIAHYGCDVPSALDLRTVTSLVKDFMIRGEALAKKKVGGALCFDDQIFLPNLWDLRLPVSSPNPKHALATDFAIGDEIQDMSKGKLALALRSIKPGGRFIGFGDKSQSIYGFAGADSNSVANIVNTTGAIELPLSISYRCPKSVVREAQAIVPHIESHPDAPEGEVRTISDTKLVNELTPGCIVLSRKTNPLIKLCISLIKSKVAAKVKGRDIGKQLLKLAQEIVGKNGSFATFPQMADAYLAKRSEVMSEWKNAESALEALRDRVEGLTAIIEGYAPDTIAGLETAIDDLFSDGGSVITLSTIHRAKGLEFDDVFIIQPEHLPLTWKGQQPWEIQQEQNLRYVAITRSKNRLTWVTTSPKAN